MYRIGSFFNITGIFRRPLTGKYRLRNLRTRTGNIKEKNADKGKKAISVRKGMKKYEKRQIEARGQRKNRFLSIKNIVIITVIILTFVFIHFSGYSLRSLYISIFIFTGLTLYLLVVERFRERNAVENEIREIKNEREREHHVFLDRIKDIEQLEKNSLKNIILKNADDYDIKVWKIGRATSLLIGKGTPRNKVDIDVGGAVYESLISRAHGILNKVNGAWYYEDLGSQNGSGIERKQDKRKIRIGKNIPIKVESGDIIYLATTKLLLK